MLARSIEILRPLLGLALLATPIAAHGGAYQGPGAGPGSTLGPLGATGAAGAPGAVAVPPTTPGDPTLDLALWNYWWEFNKAPYLELKHHVREGGLVSGGDGWFLGEGEKPQTVDFGPTRAQIRERIVPALFATLEKEKDNDLVTASLIALAKIGADGTPQGTSDTHRFEQVFIRFLTDPNQEIRETAAVSLGILASPGVIPTLAHLLWDTAEGRTLVKAQEVDYRTRSYAAYGLALVGARTSSEVDRQVIVSILRKALESDATRTRDLGIACLIGLGLVPLATIEPAVTPGDARHGPPPESSRLAQLDYVFALMLDERREPLLRAHAPNVLARLVRGLPEPALATWREKIANELLDRLKRGKEHAEFVQSAVQALGLLGTNDGKDPLDARIRWALGNAVKEVAEPQARAFALIAMAELGARAGRDQTASGIEEARDFLVDQLNWGKRWLRPWAGLACGLLAQHLTTAGIDTPAIASLRRAVGAALEDEKSPLDVGALALGAGLAADLEHAPGLLRRLDSQLQDDARGYVAVALALMKCPDAVLPLRKVVAESRYRPTLLRESAVALGILDDKDAVPSLIAMLAEAKSLATQAALANALGFIGDRRSVDPLVAMLQDARLTEKARAFAAIALGNVADKEPLPWNAKIALDLNYRAATATLTDQTTSTGVLDIL